MSNQCHAAETGLIGCNRNSSARPMCQRENITQNISKHSMDPYNEKCVCVWKRDKLKTISWNPIWCGHTLPESQVPLHIPQESAGRPKDCPSTLPLMTPDIFRGPRIEDAFVFSIRILWYLASNTMAMRCSHYVSEFNFSCLTNLSLSQHLQLITAQSVVLRVWGPKLAALQSWFVQADHWSHLSSRRLLPACTLTHLDSNLACGLQWYLS